ncbi:sigma-54-dependent Fis family transcriptional regulator [Peptoniphilus sp. oral taxon 386]|uniref:sigma-54 interaction domain-containing protein n=1 Tax=Peptoniphilus sp. oral taxon 386 TaxID=652713 RepID=UPI0001DA9E62|nr:sigma 54-interacting transcriptional regulator [Peptoniphilus sp. oral taxon 386]EFI41484.1 Sigma-54 interaction domain protein [Peptoniphilus sp. oral taxon 386 str. F0131]
MKRITILSIDEEASIFYKEQVNSIFKDVLVDYRNLEMEPVPPVKDTDLILYTDPEIINLLIKKINCDVPHLMMKRTITKAALKELNKIEADSKVLVVNINEFMANETMALIYQLGRTDIFMEPYFPGKILTSKEYDYIIHVAPEKMDLEDGITGKDIIIGHRILDVSNVLDIIYILNIEEKVARDIVLKMVNLVPTFWYGINYSLEQKYVSEAKLEFAIDYLDGGVLIVDSDFDINTINGVMCKILGISKKDVLYKNLYEVFEREEEFLKIIRDQDVKEELIKVRNVECFITVRNIEYKSEIFGKMIILREYFNVVELYNKTNKIFKSGYFSKYTFDNIIGNSFNIKESIKIAKVYSKTENPVLILGDTGTGKELFAGSIHNYSNRAKEPFVAINCSTLSATLLESELFGYEEGAFTGAKKGGKIGLFERANGGTLFLDEIGDLPMELQPRLLRALAEKKIMRVGGDKLIDVDVRIIAATNKDINKMVVDGNFRMDLLYRLNAFEINISPLHERGKDTYLIINSYMKKKGITRNFTRDFEEFCINYNWPGNVRELKNILNYIEVMTKKEVGFDSIPKNLHLDRYLSKECEFALVLKLIYALQILNRGPGRRTIEKLFTTIYYKISENEIRNILKYLEEKKFITTNVGRRGNEITCIGREYLLKERYILDYETEFIDKIEETIRSID